MEINKIQKELQITLDALKRDKNMTVEELHECVENTVNALEKLHEIKTYEVEETICKKETMVPMEYDLGIFRRFIRQEGNIMKLPIKLEEETPIKFKLFYAQLLANCPMNLEQWMYKLLDGSYDFIAKYDISNEYATKLYCSIIDKKENRCVADWITDVKIDELFIDKANSIFTKYIDIDKDSDEYKLAMINNQLNHSDTPLSETFKEYNNNLVQLYVKEKSPTMLLIPTDEMVNGNERVYDVVVKSESLSLHSILDYKLVRYGNRLLLVDSGYNIKGVSMVEFLGNQIITDVVNNSDILRASHVSFEKEIHGGTQTLLMLSDNNSYVYLYGELANYFCSSPNLTSKLFTVKNNNGKQLYYNNIHVGPIFSLH